MNFKYIVAAVGFVLMPGFAFAASHKLKALPGAGSVFVWKSKDAQSQALDLIQANASQSLILPLIACIVDPGTAAIVTDGGFATQDIMVIDGPDAGCRGNIPTEELD